MVLSLVFGVIVTIQLFLLISNVQLFNCSSLPSTFIIPCSSVRYSLHFKLISYPLYGDNAINAQLLPDLANMNVNGAVADNDVVAPHLT